LLFTKCNKIPKNKIPKTKSRKQNPEEQNPEEQNPEEQNPEKQNPEEQNPEYTKSRMIAFEDCIRIRGRPGDHGITVCAKSPGNFSTKYIENSKNQWSLFADSNGVTARGEFISSNSPTFH